MTSPADTLDSRQRAIAGEFAFLTDWMLRYEHLIEHAKTMPPLAPEARTDDRLVRGCQSKVWLHTWREDASGETRFRVEADSEAQIVRGLASLLVRALDGLPPDVVSDADLWFLKETGLAEHLSPNRANGLDAMVRQIREAAT